MGVDERNITITTTHGLEYSTELQKSLNRIKWEQDEDNQGPKVKQGTTEKENTHSLVEDNVIFMIGSENDPWRVMVPNEMAKQLTREIHNVFEHPGK